MNNPTPDDESKMPDELRDMLKQLGMFDEMIKQQEEMAKRIAPLLDGILDTDKLKKDDEYEHLDYLTPEEIILFNEMQTAVEAVMSAKKVATGKKRKFWAYLEDKRGLQGEDLKLDRAMQSILRSKK